MTDLLELVEQVVGTSIDRSLFVAEARMADLGVDSLGAAELIAGIEDQAGHST